MIFKNRKLIPMCCLKTPLKLRFKFLDEPYEIKIKYDIYLCQKRIKDKLRGISLIVDNINYKNEFKLDWLNVNVKLCFTCCSR